MYLIDKEITVVLPELQIETTNPDYPFVPEDQVQPCSIDLRLSDVFWLPNRRATIDLRKPRLLEVAPRGHWRRVLLKPSQCLTLKPGQFLLGRTYEKFSIPSRLAAGIEGRSSFARMGLSVHCTGEFINPGYTGHMTLQLVNLGPHAIKVFPYIPICQLKLIRLTGVPERLYGEKTLHSKYIDDDGGPSYWWRDKRIKILQEKLRMSDVSLDIQAEILQTIGVQEPEVLERFERFVDKTRVGNLENATVLLENFAISEDKRRSMDQVVKWGLTVPMALTGAFGLRLAFEHPHRIFHYVIWGAVLLSALLAYYGANLRLGEYLGERELRKIERALPGTSI